MAFRHNWIGRGTVLAAALAVGACAPVPRIPSPYVGCDEVPPDVFESVDWDAARRINVRIRDGEFQPSLIRLYQGRPYVMRIENRDRGARRFQSREFFQAVYIHSLTRPSGTYSVECPWGVRVSPGEVAEVRFIAARDGRYEYSDDVLPFVFGAIPDGIVHIEQPPAIAALMSPVAPGIIKPEDVPAGPYTPVAVPVVPPAPETPPSPADPALFPLPMPAPEIPAMPVEPVTLPIPMPAPEAPSPADPALLPLPMPAPEIPAMPVEPALLPIPLPAPETPPPADPVLLPPPSPAPVRPAEPEAAPTPPPAPPRSLLPQPAPQGLFEKNPGGVGLFGQ
ncbi:MAG: hypothetical protein EXR02_01405 [Rhodospirillales bacterium]|nr:hypothetical protein [Rhodospirillales bacterium]MSP79711.1 hypothetical protein [Rhodospirillales bacterium]